MKKHGKPSSVLVRRWIARGTEPPPPTDEAIAEKRARKDALPRKGASPPPVTTKTKETRP